MRKHCIYRGLEPPMSNNNDLTKQILAIAAFSGLIGGFFSPDAELFELFEDLDPEELDELIDYLIEN
tara:strand:- start:1960 stop:2160 length:201 start_codon:yes stop_codon:yes gene_type:complete